VRGVLIFDLDGVITSEAGYWTTAAEGVCLLRKRPYSPIPADFIYWAKNHAVNHNWDLAFLYDASLEISSFLPARQDLQGKDLLASCPGYRQSRWQEIHRLCQDLQNRKPPPADLLHPARELQDLFYLLHSDGWTFAVATGRPRPEALAPLAAAGLMGFFASGAIITHDEVVAEEGRRGEPLGKPHPFVVQQAMLAVGIPEPERAVFVGDTLSDAGAARAAGVRLVGVVGALPEGRWRDERRQALHAAGCHTILPSVLQLRAVLQREPEEVWV
jgi:phosphoglycolate phosphatase-like HAD superfamily hydrolase